MTNRSFTVPTASRLLGVQPATILKWSASGMVSLITTAKERGRGRERRLNEVGLLAIGIINAYRTMGAQLAAIAPAARYISSLTPAELEAELKAGRTVLVSCGEEGPTRLVRPDEAMIDDGKWAKLLMCIDVAAALTRLVAGLEREANREAILA